MCSTWPMSSCTAIPRSRSSTGPRCPTSWRPRRWRAGTRRWPSPTTTRSRARWSSPRRLATRGCAPSTVRRSPCATTRDTDPSDTRHLTLLVRDARGWINLCRLLRARTRTRATTAPGPPSTIRGGGSQQARPTGPRRARTAMTRTSRVTGDPSVTLEDVEAHAEGLVCLSGCARHGPRDLPTLRRLLRAFGRDAFRIELQRPFQRHDRALNRGLEELATRLRVPCVATGDVHAHTPARARLQDVFVAIREHTTLDASEPLRRGNHSHVLTTPEAMAARFADHPEAIAEAGRLADTPALRPHPRPRLPLPGRRGRRGRSAAGRDLPRLLRLPLPGRVVAARARRRPPRRGAARSSRRSGCRASSSCIATCSSSPGRSPSRSAGRTPPARCCRPAAVAARRSHRSSATSPASRTSTRSPTSSCSGASSTRRSRRCPTSISTSRATCARSSSRACTTASGATRRRWWPPSRPTAPAAPSARSARRSGWRPARSSAWRAGRRAGAEGRSIATSPPPWVPAARRRAAGAGWRSCRRRPTGCPATSPSTRAG